MRESERDRQCSEHPVVGWTKWVAYHYSGQLIGWRWHFGSMPGFGTPHQLRLHWIHPLTTRQAWRTSHCTRQPPANHGHLIVSFPLVWQHRSAKPHKYPQVTVELSDSLHTSTPHPPISSYLLLSWAGSIHQDHISHEPLPEGLFSHSTTTRPVCRWGLMVGGRG